METELQVQTIHVITSLDTNENEPKTYEADCGFLLDWFRKQTSIQE